MSHSYRILVIGTNREEIDSHRGTLLPAGYEVDIITDARDAIQAVANRSPDLILLAVRMATGNGLEVCSMLKAHLATASIPTIFISDDPDPDTMIRAFAVGASDYLQKPYAPQELLARISVHVRLRRAELELVEKNEQTAGLAKRLTEVNAELALLSRQDPLTQLMNRRAWQESAAMEHERTMRYGHSFGLMMIDVDFFKSYNDLHGHQAGDECLKKVSALIAGVCRRIDLAGRYGGEEFLVLAPEIEPPQLRMLAERLRKAIWDCAIPHPGAAMGRRVTVSIGCALSRPNTPLAEIINDADQALYLAKHSGRNRVCMHGAGSLTASNLQKDARASARPLPHALEIRTGTTVLLACSDAQRTRQIQDQLEAANMTVVVATQGYAVLGRASALHPDLILLDTELTRLPWKDCTDQLRSRQQTSDIPIVALGRPAALCECAEWGLDGFVRYDTDAEELNFNIHTLVRLSRSRAQLLANYEQRGEQSRVMGVLLDFCRQLVTLNDLDEMLERTMLTAMELTACHAAGLFMQSADGELTLARIAGDNPADQRHIAAPTFARRAFQTRQTQTSQFVDSDVPVSQEDAEWLARSPILCQVLDTPTEAVGILVLFDPVAATDLDARALECMELVAQVAASAIHGLMTREAHRRACDSIVVALAKLAEYRDNDTGRHLERVTHYCVMLAEQLRRQGRYGEVITEEFVSDLERAVPLHDIGKVAVPDSILLKPGKLTPEEMAIMQTHAETGADTIQFVCRTVPQATFLNMAEAIARSHHEHYDGNGYPNHLSREAIPLAARITALADVYDALTTKRVYKEAMAHEEAVRVISAASGCQFDPEIVEAFLNREADFATWAERLADDHWPHRSGVVDNEFDPVRMPSSTRHPPLFISA